ncbi:hypothetical protein TIFTF001_029879 [Ficus carica]|uniref:Uncharacterized protein n=1 Tax=Ficus carica TaxID=3494 RepID=A0AA88J2Z9_FICCA|nr:hypothetical protein TIFTF001_029879 [Ficus carica]
MFFVHLRLADRNRELPTVRTQESSMDGLWKEKKLLRREQSNLKVGRGKKTPATLKEEAWNLVRVGFFITLHHQPEHMPSSLCLSENKKGNLSTWASRGNSTICSDDCITVQSQVWTEQSYQTISV